MVPRSRMGQFSGGRGVPFCKVGSVWLSVQKRLCSLGCRVGWAQGIVLDKGSDPPRGKVILRGKLAARCIKYRHSAVICAKQMNRSRCCLGYAIGWVPGACMMMMMMRRFVERVINSPQTRCRSAKQVGLQMSSKRQRGESCSSQSGW